MSYTDKTITCSDCGATFTFTAGEQEAFAQRGYENTPKRCATCRAARRSTSPSTGGGFGSGGFGSGTRREMFPAVCAQCGQETQVPFQPREGRPVYCSSCYNKIKPAR